MPQQVITTFLKSWLTYENQLRKLWTRHDKTPRATFELDDVELAVGAAFLGWQQGVLGTCRQIVDHGQASP